MSRDMQRACHPFSELRTDGSAMFSGGPCDQGSGSGSTPGCTLVGGGNGGGTCSPGIEGKLPEAGRDTSPGASSGPPAQGHGGSGSTCQEATFPTG